RLLAKPVFPAMLLFVRVDDLILGTAFRHAVGKRHHGLLDENSAESIPGEPPSGLVIVGCLKPLANPILYGPVEIKNLIHIRQVHEAAGLLVARHECEVLNAVAASVDEHGEPGDITAILLGGTQFHARSDEAERIVCLAPTIESPDRVGSYQADQLAVLG